MTSNVWIIILTKGSFAESRWLFDSTVIVVVTCNQTNRVYEPHDRPDCSCLFALNHPSILFSVPAASSSPLPPTGIWPPWLQTTMVNFECYDPPILKRTQCSTQNTTNRETSADSGPNSSRTSVRFSGEHGPSGSYRFPNPSYHTSPISLLPRTKPSLMLVQVNFRSCPLALSPTAQPVPSAAKSQPSTMASRQSSPHTTTSSTLLRNVTRSFTLQV